MKFKYKVIKLVALVILECKEIKPLGSYKWMRLWYKLIGFKLDMWHYLIDDVFFFIYTFVSSMT